VSIEKENQQVLQREMIAEHPAISVSLAQVRVPKGHMSTHWPNTHLHDYVNALVLNDAGEAMILESYHHGDGRFGWQVPGSNLEDNEDPYQAVQRELLEETGYSCRNWLYLGSYTPSADQHIGVGHFFFATGAKRIAEPNQGNLAAFDVKWVSVKDLKYALLDGRIGVISYAVNIALALLMIEKQFH
jgi:ADP-ribose pyrophosphatase